MDIRGKECGCLYLHLWTDTVIERRLCESSPLNDAERDKWHVSLVTLPRRIRRFANQGVSLAARVHPPSRGLCVIKADVENAVRR